MVAEPKMSMTGASGAGGQTIDFPHQSELKTSNDRKGFTRGSVVPFQTPAVG
jgi:hypothetical protein